MGIKLYTKTIMKNLQSFIYVFYFLFLGLVSSAQINFEKGYFIDNATNKIECFIRNPEKFNTPENFVYKINENDTEVKTKTINDVLEFYIEGYYKFEKHEVLIDVSNQKVDDLTTGRNPEWAKKTLFLKLISNGDAKLYSYVNDGIEKFFFSTTTKPIEQLVFKKYKSDNVATLIYTNNYYQQQLWNSLKCNQINLKQIERINYQDEDLINIFSVFNKSNGSLDDKKTISNNPKQKKGSFNFKLKAGTTYNSFSIYYINSSPYSLNQDFTLDSKLSYRFGGEIEFILPFNKNKWGLVIEPSYQSKYEDAYTQVIDIPNSPIDFTRNIYFNYSSLDIFFGLKYYMFLNANSKLFLSCNLVYNKNFDNNFTINETTYDNLINSKPSLAYGFGYNYKKYTVECRINSRDLLEKQQFFKSKYTSISVNLTYILFNSKNNK